MKRILLGIAATLMAGAAAAMHPSEPVPITDTTTAINTSRMVNQRPVQPPNGVPSVVVPNVFSNPSSTTAQVYAYVNSPGEVPYPCGSDPRPTSVDVIVFPIGQPASPGLRVPMNEHLAVRRAGEDYCSAEMSVGPVFIPPGNQLDFNVVYSTLPDALAPVRFHVHVNGFYMK